MDDAMTDKLQEFFAAAFESTGKERKVVVVEIDDDGTVTMRDRDGNPVAYMGGKCYAAMKKVAHETQP